MIQRMVNIPHLAALRHRDYLLTWSSNMCSGAGMWTFIVAVSWLILEKSDSSGDVGIVTFASMLPFLVASPFAGLIADALDRRDIARVTFISNALLTAIVTVLATTGALTLWHLSVLTFISGVMRSTQEPAMSALIPNQVPREDLLNAVTLNAATRHGARFFGLLVAAPLLAIPAIGVTGVLVLSALFQVAGTVFISTVRTRSTGEVILGRNILADVMVGLWNGVRYIYTNKMISIFILLVAFHCALVMSYDSVLPVFSRDTLGAVDGSLLGYIVMSFGVGALVTTVLMAGVREERNKGRWMLWTGVIGGLTPVALAFSPEWRSALLISAVMGGSQAAFMALTTTYVQTIAPDRLRGRISSLYILHAGGIMAFANLGYGFMADALTAPPILYATAAAFLAFLFSANLSLPDLRRIYRTGQATPAEAAA